MYKHYGVFFYPKLSAFVGAKCTFGGFKINIEQETQQVTLMNQSKERGRSYESTIPERLRFS